MGYERQKLHFGDLVRITDSLPKLMSHFRAGCEALVLGSYRDLCHGDGEPDKKTYAVLFVDSGDYSAWYGEEHLDFVRHAGAQAVENVYERKHQGLLNAASP